MRKQDGTLVRIQSPQGSRVVGRLVNNVLHIDRDYEKHHLHKYRGWAMSTDVFSQNPGIRGIRINAENAPLKGGDKGNRIYLFSFDEAGMEPNHMEVKNFGHGDQVFIPDNLWEVLDTNGFLRTEKPEPQPEPEPSPEADETVTFGSFDISPAPPDPFEVSVDQASISWGTLDTTPKAPSYRAFSYEVAVGLLEAGYTIHLFEMQKGLKLSKQGHNYVLNVPGVHMDIHVDFSEFSEGMKHKRHTLDF